MSFMDITTVAPAALAAHRANHAKMVSAQHEAATLTEASRLSALHLLVAMNLEAVLATAALNGEETIAWDEGRPSFLGVAGELGARAGLPSHWQPRPRGRPAAGRHADPAAVCTQITDVAALAR